MFVVHICILQYITGPVCLQAGLTELPIVITEEFRHFWKNVLTFWWRVRQEDQYHSRICVLNKRPQLVSLA